MQQFGYARLTATVQLLNLIALFSLLLFAAVMTPLMLMEAFNPATTNIPLMVLGYYLYRQNLGSSEQEYDH